MKYKIKCISFLPEFIPLIKSGKKTVTRRINFSGDVGDIYYFKAGRHGKKEGYIKITNIRIEKLGCAILIATYSDSKGATYEYELEGFNTLSDFIKTWDCINKKGYRWKDQPSVYRIEFKYLESEG